MRVFEHGGAPASPAIGVPSQHRGELRTVTYRCGAVVIRSLDVSTLFAPGGNCLQVSVESGVIAMKILLAVDGSSHSRRAVRYVTSNWRLFEGRAALTLLHVDPPLMTRVARALGREEVQRYHADNAKASLKHARAALRRARIAYTEQCLVGDPGTTISQTASAGRYAMVVMGSHGHGAFGNLLLGSVVTKVLHGCKVPVLIVR